MDRATPNLLRHWLDVLGEAPDLRIAAVLEARDRIRRASYDGECVLDRTLDRLVPVLR